MLKSTRLSIVEQAISDVLLRLAELPRSPRVRELFSRAESYGRAARGWASTPPSEEQRSAMMKLVIELALEVMTEGRAPPPPGDARVEQPDAPAASGDPPAPSSVGKLKRQKPATPKGRSSVPTRGPKKLKG